MKTLLTFLLLISAIVAHAGEDLVDQKLAQNAVAVVRVKLIFAADLKPTPFMDYNVHNIRVFKNESNERFVDIQVLGYKGRPGVPEEECTIYIQRYDPITKTLSTSKDHGQWILVGGDATNGVSHVGASILK